MAEVEVGLKHTVQRMSKVSTKITRFYATIETYEGMRASQAKSGFNLESIDETINCYLESINEQACIMADMCDQLKGKL